MNGPHPFNLTGLPAMKACLFLKPTLRVWSRLLSGRLRLLTLLLLCSNSAQASASEAVPHQHDARQHSHPLPLQGIYHRHGNTGYGRYINRSGRITGTLTPQRTVPTTPPRPANNAQPQRGSISATLRQGNQTRILSIVDPNRRSTVPKGPAASKSPALALTQGRTTQQKQTQQGFTQAQQDCERSARNCNVCAVDVKHQFKRAASGQINWRTEFWHFDWDQPYPPYQLRARHLLAGQQKDLFGIPAKHIQGFIHTNSPQYPFAASHSHRSTGGLLLIEQNPQGEKYLAALYNSQSRHPSGLHAIGHYLAYGEQGQLWLKDLQQPEPTTPDIRLAMPGPAANFGGGLGIVKLAGNGHLLVTTGPGGQDQRPRFNRFYYLRSRNGRPAGLRFLNQSAQPNPAQWPKGLAFSENLSLLSECGSGDIYAIHSGGDEDEMSVIRGQGYWRLSKVVVRQQRLSLRPLSAFMQPQNMDKCSLRAAATVRVNPDHQLEFYCHGYAKNPEGSMLNILGKAHNRFYFKVGVPH